MTIMSGKGAPLLLSPLLSPSVSVRGGYKPASHCAAGYTPLSLNTHTEAHTHLGFRVNAS